MVVCYSSVPEPASRPSSAAVASNPPAASAAASASAASASAHASTRTSAAAASDAPKWFKMGKDCVESASSPAMSCDFRPQTSVAHGHLETSLHFA